MTVKSVEERLASLEVRNDRLEERNIKLQHELDRVQAVIEIQNLMSRYEWWHTAGLHDKKEQFVAKKAPGARIEYVNSGVYEGNEGVRKFLVDTHKYTAQGSRAGKLTFHPLTTPVIEVAGDGKTARGLWLSPGIETHDIKGKLVACWCWESYAADFVKEDGIWKWWRIHLIRGFIIPFDKSWVDINVAEFFESLGVNPDRFPANLRPDRPTTYHKMFSLTDTCCWTEGIPVAPEPYETYDESMAVVQPGGDSRGWGE